MTLARLTWQPVGHEPETLTVDIPAERIREMRDLIGTPEWAASEAVMRMPCRCGDDGPFTPRLFRLARITHIEKEHRMKTCDNTSVGVIITNAAGEYLMFDRNTFPPGTAPVAGHVDTHGTVREAAEAEVREEVGLTVVSLSEITTGWRNNRCRRLPGPRGVGHQWTIFHAVVTGELAPSARETRNVRWITRADVLALCSRTSRYAAGDLSDAEFAARPGIEPVWVQWLLTPDSWLRDGELDLIDQLANTTTPKES